MSFRIKAEFETLDGLVGIDSIEVPSYDSIPKEVRRACPPAVQVSIIPKPLDLLIFKERVYKLRKIIGRYHAELVIYREIEVA